MEVIVRPAAAGDIEGAYRWYEDRRHGLGDEFLAELSHTITSIKDHPSQYPVLHRDTRRALLHRFPYGLFYRIRTDALRVGVVATGIDRAIDELFQRVGITGEGALK